MPFFIDQTGRQIILDKTPRKIISVVPSQTELLFDLGLHDEVIGITKFCVHPTAWFRNKPKVGGTKHLKLEIIHRLQPDLIIANKEENVKEQIYELEKYFPVWVSDVNNLTDACQMIEQIGLMSNKNQQAIQLTGQIKKNFSQLPAHQSRLPACYLIWQKPYMAAGSDTFIHSMMEAAGFSNIFKQKTRYPEITIDEIIRQNPAVLLLSSEPFPFTKKHAAKIKEQGFKGQVLLADGEMFSWYGSRLLKAPAYFSDLRNQAFLSPVSSSGDGVMG